MLRLSPSGISASSPQLSTVIIFSAGTDSPVRAASSTLRLAHSKSRQSAGTESPASSTTTSPTTRSSLRTEIILPSRSTLEVAALISCKAWIAASALLSCTTPSTVFISTTTMIMTVSVGKPTPFSIHSVAADMTAATMRIIIIGSES